MRFTGSARFKASSLSNLANNIAEGIHKIRYKYGNDNKKYKTCGIRYKNCECCLEYTNVKDVLVVYNCLFCNKNCQKYLRKLEKAIF